MSGLEVNKFFASIILALIVIGIISFVGDIIINGKDNEQAKNAYKIVVDTESKVGGTSTQNEDIFEPISIFLASASVEKGEKLFKKCSACHSYEKDGANKVGPNLWNAINRPKGSIQGFVYSKALANFGGNWGYEEMSQFLYKPKEYIEGTKMNFSGLKKVEDRANLIVFLSKQSDSPATLP